MINSFEEKSFEGLEGELHLSYCGKRIGNIGHSYGPYERDEYLIYYIKEGEAELFGGGDVPRLVGEGIFVNFPHSGCVYRANAALPWSIKWISAGGELVGRYFARLGLTPEQPYKPIENGREVEAVFDEMYEHFDRPSLSSRIFCVSLLYKLFSLLSADAGEGRVKNAYVRSALAMIEERYADPALTVFSLAEALDLHPNYFSILFKRECGMLPKQAILDTRMRSAAKMLRFTDRPIKEIAGAVGFSDELYFSRVFRARYGVAPTGYRRRQAYLT